jgi:hypothetical protein
LFSIERARGPLGVHSYYEKFRYRNSVVQTFHKKYEKVSILGNDFHSRSPLERWREWVGHKLHLISPVFNDLPIRFFDALLTGGIPLVPQGIKPYLSFLDIPEEFFVCYSPGDIISPEQVVEEAEKRFDSQGATGIMRRHLFSLQHFHVDAVIEKIIAHCEDLYCRST